MREGECARKRVRKSVRGRGRVLALLAGCLVGTSARAQLVGHIATFKQQYLAGEPVYVSFELTNAGKEAVQYVAGDPYSQGCSIYSLEVSSGPPLKHSSCERGMAAECPAGNQILSPGTTVQQNILVNYAHDVSKPGNYEIRAALALKYAPVGEGDAFLTGGGKNFKFEEKFQIQVLNGDKGILETIYRPYVKNLESRDDDIKREAERAIVSGAPPWLEDTIIRMLASYTSREFALLGLKNLNTARSRAELGKVIQSTSEYTQEGETAIRYLAQMGDKRYFPLLCDIAEKDTPDQARDHVWAAAELGGDEALPFLRVLMSRPDAWSKANAVMGLEKTGSREAVPLLIETLKSPDADLGKLALTGLVGLTHRSMLAEGDPPAEEYGAWSKWWEENGKRAPVYGPRECGEVERLESRK